MTFMRSHSPPKRFKVEQEDGTRLELVYELLGYHEQPPYLSVRVEMYSGNTTYPDIIQSELPEVLWESYPRESRISRWQLFTFGKGFPLNSEHEGFVYTADVEKEFVGDMTWLFGEDVMEKVLRHITRGKNAEQVSW